MNLVADETRDYMHIDWDVPIAMNDGLTLRTDVFRPLAQGRSDVAKYMRLNAMFYLGHWHLLRGERAQAVRSFHEVLVMCERLRSEGSAASWLRMALSAGGSLHTEFNAARAELLAMGERVD